MAAFMDRLRYHARSFFTNWSTFEAPLGTKVRLTLGNRWRAIVMLKGCCGNPGQPGC